MSFYENTILPHLINCACSTKPVLKQREKIVPRAQGVVLEVGMGSGINIDYYDADKVEKVYGLEPSPGMRKKAVGKVANAPFDLQWLDLPGEAVPLQDDSVDTIVLTYTLCSIVDWLNAIKQMRRVLRPEGRLLFSEHGKAPDANVQKWQNRVNGLWGKVAGGCNLNRDIPFMLEQGGFNMSELHTLYLPNTPKIAGFTYWGEAT